jgi:hypothetical protein
MHLHPDGRQVQVPRRWAVEQIAGAFGDPQNHLSMDRAERFLEEDEIGGIPFIAPLPIFRQGLQEH